MHTCEGVEAVRKTLRFVRLSREGKIKYGCRLTMFHLDCEGVSDSSTRPPDGFARGIHVRVAGHANDM